MEEQAKLSIRKRLLSYFHAHRRNLISVAIFVPSVLTIGIYLGVQMDRHFVAKDGIYKDHIYWSCDRYWDGIISGFGKWCEAPLGYGVSLRYNTGWATPDIGDLARIVPAPDTHHSLTHVALVQDRILVKTNDATYYILSFENQSPSAPTPRESVYGPLNEDEFFALAPDADIPWLEIPKP